MASYLNDACRRTALIDVSSYPADTEVPSFAKRAKCGKSGAIDKRWMLVKDGSVLSSDWGDMNMKRRWVVAILALAMSFPVAAAEKQPEQSPGSQQQTYTPSLAVVMGLIQISHFKLWLAGNLRNWPLAEYELSQMKATLQDAKILFPNVPAADTRAISQSAEEFRDAIRAKDGPKFDRAFKKFTSECNSCHEGVGRGFIKIRVPVTSPIMTSPLSNQLFAP
jgi:hypothetical protein